MDCHPFLLAASQTLPPDKCKQSDREFLEETLLEIQGWKENLQDYNSKEIKEKSLQRNVGMCESGNFTI